MSQMLRISSIPLPFPSYNPARSQKIYSTNLTDIPATIALSKMPLGLHVLYSPEAPLPGKDPDQNTAAVE